MNLTIPNIPSAYNEALDHIQTAFPEAVIAGGCLRDLILYRQDIKDIDIMIYGNPKVAAETGEIIENSRLFKDYRFEQFKSGLQTYAMNFNDVVNVWNSQPMHDLGCRVQLIMLQCEVNSESVASRCDFGICRIAYDGCRLFLHDDFLYDLKHEVFTLRKNSYIESHAKRWLRFKDRFTDFTLGMEGEYQALAAELVNQIGFFNPG